MNLKRVLRIARKDFFDQLRNWRILFYFLYLAMWFGALIVVRWSGIFPMAIVIAAPDDSSLLPEVLAMPQAMPGFVRVVRAADEADLHTLMQTEEADLGIIVGVDFDEALANDEQAPIEFIRAEGRWEASMLQGLVESQAENLAPPPEPTLQVQESTVTIEKQDKKRVSVTPLIPLGQTNLLGFMMTLLILVDQGSNSLFVVPYQVQKERKAHMMEALLVSPLTHLELLSGKFLGAWGYGLITSSFFLVPILLLAPNIPLLVATVLLATAVLNLVGLLIGVIFTSQQVANSFVSIFAMPWTLTTYLGFLKISGPWGVDLLLQALPTVQMGHAMLLALTNDVQGAIRPIMLLCVQLVVLMLLMVGVLKRQENV